ncbi:MAG: bifunctional DNA-formamidopyrimidine glycosylase/DNA-(apurinic or apyrimidinic site) lyase [Planctomycetota bacterium]|nr:bifunctional DNA-formamidopyrimidine glycosylase/DNA-(apurinic or apyrimidinic site) lyase [Planctomycetota bacterium]
MPELPEVETTARLIEPGLLGRTIRGVQVEWLRSLGGMSRPKFERAVVGAKVSRVWRRAKYVVIDLQRRGKPAGVLLVHLRMTGRLVVTGRGVDAPDYNRVSLELDRGNLHFLDVRKFGRFTFHPEASPALEHLGPEPLSDATTPEFLYGALGARKRAIKPLLLDQTFLAGLGNIYVDESLFGARIHPQELASRVSKAKALKLHAEIQRVLREAIVREGSSFDAFYRTPEGQPGSYQHLFRAYGRTGKPCERCQRPIRRIVVGQRGTHFCPRCQVLSKASR